MHQNKSNNSKKQIGYPHELPLVGNCIDIRAYYPNDKYPDYAIPLLIGSGIIPAFLFTCLWIYAMVLIVKLYRPFYGVPGFAVGFAGLITFIAMSTIAGFGCGYCIAWLSRICKCRNKRKVAISSLIAAIIGCFIFNFFYGQGILKNLPGQTNSAVWIIIIILGIPFVLSSWITSLYIPITDEPFCDKCNKWYVSSKKAYFDNGFAEPFFETIKSHSTDNLQYMEEYLRPADDRPILEVSFKHCPSCNADYILDVYKLYMKEVTMEEKKEIVDKRARYFRTLILPDIGKELNRTIQKLPKK